MAAAATSVSPPRAPTQAPGLVTPSQKRANDKARKRNTRMSNYRTPEELKAEVKDLQDQIAAVFILSQRVGPKIPRSGKAVIQGATNPTAPIGAGNAPYTVEFTRSQLRATLKALISKVGKLPVIIKASLRRVRDTDKQKREGKGQYTPVFMGNVLRTLFNSTDRGFTRDEKTGALTPGPETPFLGTVDGKAGSAPLLSTLPAFAAGYANSQSISLAFIVATDILGARMKETRPALGGRPGTRQAVMVQFTPAMENAFTRLPALYGATKTAR